MSLPMMRIHQRRGMSAVLKKEVDPELCRTTGTLLAGSGGPRSLKLGQLVAKLTEGGGAEVSVVPVPANTGNGELTVASPATTSAAKTGRYTITFLAAEADAGTFKVEDPAGVSVGVGKVGVAFGKQVRFTIADGSTDFAAGDQFLLDVSVGNGADIGKIVAWDPSAHDGSDVIFGVCLKDCEAQEGQDLFGGVLISRRLSLLYAPEIVWPEGISDAVKAVALADMEDRLGLIARS